MATEAVVAVLSVPGPPGGQAVFMSTLRDTRTFLTHVMPFARHKIFKSGMHKPEKGKKVWSKEDVETLLENTKKHSPERIPYTFRHPSNNLPVFGYALRDELELHEEGGEAVITAKPADFARPWVDALKQLGTDKISIGIGKLGEIVHNGFTDKPAVDGLGAAFEAERESLQQVPVAAVEEVEFEAGDLDNPAEALFEVSWKRRLQSWMQDAAGIFRRLREREIEANGVEAADKLIPDYMIDFLNEPLPGDETGEEKPEPVNSFEADMDEKERQEFEQLKKDNDELKRKNEELLQTQSAAEQARIDAEIEGFCAEHATVVVPKIKPQVKAILRDLYGAEPQQFEAGDGRKAGKSSYDLMKEIIAGGRVQFVFEEVATADRAGEGEKKSALTLSQRADAETAAAVERATGKA